MPMYEYKCHQCGEVFELRQSFSDAPLTLHEGCGGAVERLISAPALQFKGSGWYITDYARSNGKKKESGEAGKSEAKAETKSSDASSSTNAPAAPTTTSTEKK